MRALLLGTESFFDVGRISGMQHIAAGLAKNGWQVDYISSSSSPLDLLVSEHRDRFLRTWIKRFDKKGEKISDNLMEYSFRTFFPTRREIFRFNWQIKLYPSLLPDRFSHVVYDLCMHEASLTVLFLPMIKARNLIFRLNDPPSGFSFALHPAVISIFDRMVADGIYNEIWAVSRQLADYATRLNSGNRVIVLPNGINLESFSLKSCAERKAKSAVFVGHIFPWFDQELIDKTARLLPDWSIDCYGPVSCTKWNVQAPNVRYCGVIEHSKMGKILEQYCVGLIPFRDEEFTKALERPLKFYEYIASGLGVASTDVGSLREGMGNWAKYGRTPEKFSQAIVEAAKQAAERKPEEIRNFLNKNSWDNIIKVMLKRLEKILKISQIT